jgi:hypothetical protein
MTRFIKQVQIGLLGMMALGVCVADDLPYKEGAVTEVSSIKVKEGHFLDYLAYLDTSYKQIMDEAKKEGLILDWSVFAAHPKNPQEPDLYLTVDYANFAALDGLEAKMNAIDAKVFGSTKQASQKDAERESIRTVLGSEIIQELKLK